MQIFEESKDSFEWCGLLWVPKTNKFGSIYGYSAEIKNLFLKIIGNELTITNSLQKFYMDSNHKMFTYTQTVEAFEILNNYFPFDIYDAAVKKIAIGTVIQEETDLVLNSWFTFSNKLPFAMLSKNKMYGLKYYLSDYDLKGYNKTTEEKNHNNSILNQQLFRFELEIKRIHCLNKGKNQIGIYTIQDLINPIKYKKLATLLLDKYHKIEKKPTINLTKTSLKEKRLIASFKDFDVLNSIKKLHPNSYKKDRREYKNLTLKLNDNTFQTQIINKLNQQIQYSINN